MCQVNGDGHFRPPGAPKPLNRFTLNLARVIRSTVRPHMQNMVAAENGGGVRIWVKLYPRVLFIFILVPSTCPQLNPRSVDFRSVHPKTCFVVGVFLWGQIFPFYPNIFQWTE